MCNAWNHHPSCTCGFGGQGHLGRSGGRPGFVHTGYPPGVPPIRDYVESFTIPNARCPVCGAFVFFYRSPHDGRVFFDELGPPWPKHPCTDRGAQHQPRPAQRADVLILRPHYNWQRNGWSPLLAWTIGDLDRVFWHLSATFGDRRTSFYVRKEAELEMILRDDAPLLFARPVVDKQYEISAWKPRRSVQFTGWTSLFEARQRSSAVIAPPPTGGVVRKKPQQPHRKRKNRKRGRWRVISRIKPLTY
jgi:hypothetical protein